MRRRRKPDYQTIDVPDLRELASDPHARFRYEELAGQYRPRLADTDAAAGRVAVGLAIRAGIIATLIVAAVAALPAALAAINAWAASQSRYGGLMWDAAQTHADAGDVLAVIARVVGVILMVAALSLIASIIRRRHLRRRVARLAAQRRATPSGERPQSSLPSRRG